MLVKTTSEEHRLAYSVAELAAITSTSITFIRSQIKRGFLKASRVGRRLLITPEGARQWLEEPPLDRRAENDRGRTRCTAA